MAGDIDATSRLLGNLEQGMQQGHEERAKLFELVEAQGQLLHTIAAQQTQLAQSLASLVGDGGRLMQVEAVAKGAAEGVADWQQTKGAAVKLMSGVTLGAGIGGGTLGHWVGRLWERMTS